MVDESKLDWTGDLYSPELSDSVPADEVKITAPPNANSTPPPESQNGANWEKDHILLGRFEFTISGKDHLYLFSNLSGDKLEKITVGTFIKFVDDGNNYRAITALAPDKDSSGEEFLSISYTPPKEFPTGTLEIQGDIWINKEGEKSTSVSPTDTTTPSTAAESSDTTNTNLADIIARIAQNQVDYEYLIRRYSQRTGQLTMPFSPRLLAGFPCIVKAKFYSSVGNESTNDELLFGYISGLQHTIDIDSGNAITSLSVSMLRTQAEDDDLKQDFLQTMIGVDYDIEEVYKQLKLGKTVNLDSIPVNRDRPHANLSNIKQLFRDKVKAAELAKGTYFPNLGLGDNWQQDLESKLNIPISKIDSQREGAAKEYSDELIENQSFVVIDDDI